MLNPLWHNFYALGQFFIVVNGVNGQSLTKIRPSGRTALFILKNMANKVVNLITDICGSNIFVPLLGVATIRIVEP